MKHDDVLIVAGVNLVILLPTLRALLLLKPNDVVVVDRRIRTMIPVKNVMLSSRTQVLLLWPGRDWRRRPDGPANK